MTTREFPLQLLKEITDDFSEKHIIGRGGYGVVYKGVLADGEKIALKRLFPVHGLDDTQFTNELNNLMRAQHPNVTRLVGYCYNEKSERVKLNDNYVFAHSDEKVLCFDYLQGGSLDKHISDESCGLDWHTRFGIIRGICDGLNYLHNGSKDPIYHLDLKPENILLDENMIPKIGDFGLSRLFPSAQTYVTIKVIGTIGYMPPEFIERREITSKFDVFSLGVIIMKIVAGYDGYSKCAHMSSEDFIENVNENWGKRLEDTMSSYAPEQVTTCIEIALRCVENKREKRPDIADIVEELNKVDSTESSSTSQIARIRSWNSERRGRIVFSTTYRPSLPLDIFSCPLPRPSTGDEVHLTDGMSHNYNGRPIPPAALKTLLKHPKLADEGIDTDADIDSGHISGLVFISERDDDLETLYIALRFNVDGRVRVFALADIFGTADFSGVRLEDSGCIGGGYSVESRTIDHSLIYVSTKELVHEHDNRSSVVYKTNLTTGKTERITPKGVFDLSPAVSPSGKTIAVASFESKSSNGENDNLMTDIYVMNVDKEGDQGLGRKLLIKDGGWPSWGSDNIIFFHRATKESLPQGKVETSWGVFRYNLVTEETVQVTPKRLEAVTPAAISETKVAVATIRPSRFGRYPALMNVPVHMKARYRHIEIFDTNALEQQPVQITQETRPEADHYNPFVLDGGGRIGYHRCRSDLKQKQHGDDVAPNLHKLDSPMRDVGLFRVSGVVFPAISKDGSKLAFVDHEFKALWIADSEGLRIIYQEKGANCIFFPVWNQNPDKDILYVCIGPSFNAHGSLEIYGIRNPSAPLLVREIQRLTHGKFNNAFPSSSPDGNKFVFRSTRAGGDKKYNNLYIMLEAEDGDLGNGWETRLTRGQWTDTQCQWSPSGDWIVFSSTRDSPAPAADLDNGQDPRYLSVFLVKATDPTVVVRVMSSAGDPVFSLDGRRIAVTACLMAASVDPISLPNFKDQARTYRDILVVDIGDPEESKKTKDVMKGFRFRRITHSRYGCGTPAWTRDFAVIAQWNMLKPILLGQPPARRKGRTMLHLSKFLFDLD